MKISINMIIPAWGQGLLLVVVFLYIWWRGYIRNFISLDWLFVMVHLLSQPYFQSVVRFVCRCEVDGRNDGDFSGIISNYTFFTITKTDWNCRDYTSPHPCENHQTWFSAGNSSSKYTWRTLCIRVPPPKRILGKSGQNGRSHDPR